ncbi:ergothioneine biosynthesis PLP-dependent enzyme EgtE [Nonomuraea jabiensis]|uniref:Pyridoxal 5-phosphate dependent beta-lyase n=1 Tax=Nonomuraea jabiensis TaxID=882448 RepID=A0A7W9G1M1_9ACTN|nr:ergothioneine biosynthesis PLP-dependent enzyme EgtE [Nonomuraea jabiensis]MBB5775477.1 pyridoxal 5-phosphate dependent beta-lyase [Nonomuraea jabiensis]
MTPAPGHWSPPTEAEPAAPAAGAGSGAVAVGVGPGVSGDRAGWGARAGEMWRAARSVVPPGHLDAAGCNVPSDRVFDAVVAHLRLERERGGYAAVPDLTPARSALAGLVGGGPEDVAFLESGTAAMAALLGGWRLPPGSRVAHARTEYGSTLMLLHRLAAERGWQPVELPVDGAARLDLEGLRDRLAAGLDLVIVSHVASHRGVVQPAEEIGALCRAAGVPLVLDVCQSLGHVEVRGAGATAYVGTSRKWLAGPRGVGFLIVPGLTPAMDAAVPTLGGHRWSPDGDGPVPLPGVVRFESSEAAVAARAGLGAAVLELHELGLFAVHAHLADLGRTARGVLDGAGGWRVVEPLDEPSALVTLRPPPGDSAQSAAVRAAEASLLVNVVPTARAPLDLREPVLRVSPPPGTPVETLHALARVLAR